MTDKILVSTVEEAKRYFQQYGKDIEAHCQLSESLEAMIKGSVRQELQLLPEMATYHYRLPFNHHGRICQGGPHKKAEMFHNSLASVKLVIGGTRYKRAKET